MSNSFKYGLGYELEAYKMKLIKVKKIMKDAEFHRKRMGSSLNYQKYNILDEADITEIKDTLYGGEIISPILYDEEALKNSIDYVLKILKKTNACNLEESRSFAGLHFHFGLEALNNNFQNYYHLIKFMSAFSGEIYYYSHSPYEGLRISIHEYAKPYPKAILDNFLEKYKNLEFRVDNTFAKKANNPLLLFSSKSHMYRFTDNTVEFRTCNCPLIPCENETFDVQKSYMQFLDYVTFYQKIIKYLTSNNLDLEMINYYYELERNNPFVLDKKRHEDIKKILKLEK